MNRRILPLLSLWTAACAPEPEPLSCTPDPSSQLIASTTDFATGALSVFDLVEGELHDPVALAGGDPFVRALSDGRVALLERGGGHHLRLYTPGCWGAPDLEVGLPGANPHDILLHGGELWLAPYAHNALWILDPADGRKLGEVDLSAEADEDGLPEVDRLVVFEGRLFAALQRLDRGGGSRWEDAGGRVVEIDPVAREVVGSWEVGPSPRLYADEDGLVVLTGMYSLVTGGEGVFSPDGALARLDPEAGALQTVWTEAEAGFDFHAWARAGSYEVVVGVDAEIGGPGRVICYDREHATMTEGPPTDAWYADVIAADGEVWLSARSGFVSPGTGDGLVRLDPARCEPVESVEMTLEPYTLTWRPAMDAARP